VPLSEGQRAGADLPSNPSPRVRSNGNKSAPRYTSPTAGRHPGNNHVRSANGSNGRSPLLRRFESYLHKHSLSPATVRNYLADLRAFARWHDSHKHRTAGFSPVEFGAYRKHLCQETDHSPATVNRRLQSLRLFGRFLHETGQAAENPTRDIALIHNRNGDASAPRILTQTEIVRLMNALHGARPSLAARDLAIVQLMLQAGLRVHEVAALRLGDLMLSSRNARVQVRGHPDSEPRRIPLSFSAATALRDYLTARPAVPRVEHLFISQRGQPLSLRSIQRLVDTYAETAGLRNVCAQSLRHTCAKNLLEATHDPVAVARWLGHRNTKTLDKYKVASHPAASSRQSIA
jgi:site-specific recombinase XerD